jgi:tRNA (guanine-N7-)-methyltransferase
MRKKKFYRKVVYEHPEGIFPWLQDSKLFRDWLEVMRQGRPLTLELGAGTSDFLIYQAKHFPKRFFLAVESKPDRLFNGFKKAQQQGLANIVFLQADIKHLMRYRLPMLEAIYLLFSDPWPKSRHHTRRLTSQQFLEIYQELLKPHGDLMIKTDSQMLFEYSREVLTNQGWSIEDEQNAFETPEEEKTAYERKFLQQQKNIWYIKAHPPNKKEQVLGE